MFWLFLQLPVLLKTGFVVLCHKYCSMGINRAGLSGPHCAPEIALLTSFPLNISSQGYFFFFAESLSKLDIFIHN